MSPPVEQVDFERLAQELDLLRARLEEAEWALAHLGRAGEPLEQRVKEMLAAARAEANTLRNDARSQAEELVREAERLRVMAQHAAAGGTEQARKNLAKKVGDMVDNADMLRRNAEKQADDLMRTARESVAPAEARAAELGEMIAARELELGQLDDELLNARRQADTIIRNAKVEAEARVAELTERAKQRLEAVRLESERTRS